MIPTGFTGLRRKTKLTRQARQSDSHLDPEHEPVGRVQDEAEDVDRQDLEDDGPGSAGVTGSLLLHPQDDSQSVESHQADQEV